MGFTDHSFLNFHFGFMLAENHHLILISISLKQILKKKKNDGLKFEKWSVLEKKKVRNRFEYEEEE